MSNESLSTSQQRLGGRRRLPLIGGNSLFERTAGLEPATSTLAKLCSTY